MEEVWGAPLRGGRQVEAHGGVREVLGIEAVGGRGGLLREGWLWRGS